MNKVRLKCIMTIVCSSVVGMITDGHSIMASSTKTDKNYYTNPIIHADYSDPDVVATPDGGTFYMTASSFQCTPGLPILRSDDLVNWELVNYAIKGVPPYEIYSDGKVHHGKGVWAPSIKFHEGEYFIYWGDPDYGIFMTKTSDPEGEWSEPVLVRPGKGLIDPTPFWDEDGQAYLANGWAASRAGFNSVITISRMSPDGKEIISDPVLVYDGNDGVNHTVEGPKMYKRGDYYYLFAPAGGVATGWQLVMRSKDVFGPYESKIVMSQGDTDINGPHQGAWITTDMGEDWFIHFQDKGPYGRVTHLNPMKWENEWPVIGVDDDGDGCGNPVAVFKKPSTKKTSEKLSKGNIYNQFQWHSNYKDFYGFRMPDGSMRIYSDKLSSSDANLWETNNLWLMKFPDQEFTFTADMRISSKVDTNGVSSGVIVMGYDYCRLGLTVEEDKLLLQYAQCENADQGSKEVVKTIAAINPGKVYEAGLIPNMSTDIKLRISVDKNAVCRFAYSLDGKKYIELPETFKASVGKWIGAKVGFYSVMPDNVADRGWLDINDISVISKE